MSENKAKIYGYVINLNERGEFYADVRDFDDNTIYEVRSDEDGEIVEVEFGYMKHSKDIAGLKEHLVGMNLMSKNDHLVEERHFFSLQAKHDNEELEADDLAP